MDQTLQKTIKNAVGAFTLVLLLVGVFMVIKIADGFNVIDENSYNTITVEGDHEVFAAPDIATISFGARSEEKELTDAQANVEKTISAAITAIKTLGVDEKDIKTTYYNSFPVYKYNDKCTDYGCQSGERVLTGYEVSQTVSITIRDLDKVSGVLAAAGNAGASDMNGPSFDIENRDELMQEARKEAIKEAKEKAKVLANELDVNLGKIVSYYDGGNGYPMPYMAKGGDMDASYAREEAQTAPAFDPTIPEGQNRIYSSVSIVYKIR